MPRPRLSPERRHTLCVSLRSRSAVQHVRRALTHSLNHSLTLTPSLPASLPPSLTLLRGRCGTWRSARARMYALAFLGLRSSAGGFCVAGAALGALEGVGCTPWRPLVSAFAWQVWDLVHCQGVGVRPGVPWSPPLCR